eukprot:TRINITY_DN11570_c0_g1_i2.p1 TRINITY_DN11570_c0_g1~~TRINITY_DN11570_c0_g1_i2.p1  ORF type:complete len:350 (-),score=60.85 TRINITY_DN11570_c0_g1_i2:349-1338(-)
MMNSSSNKNTVFKTLAAFGAASLLVCAPLANAERTLPQADAAAPAASAATGSSALEAETLTAYDTGERFIRFNRDLLPGSGAENLPNGQVPETLKSQSSRNEPMDPELCAKYCSQAPNCDGASYYDLAAGGPFPGAYPCVLKEFPAAMSDCYVPPGIADEANYEDGDYFLVRWPEECGEVPDSAEVIMAMADGMPIVDGPAEAPMEGLVDGPAEGPGIESFGPEVGPAQDENAQNGAPSAMFTSVAFAAAAAVAFALAQAPSQRTHAAALASPGRHCVASRYCSASSEAGACGALLRLNNFGVTCAVTCERRSQGGALLECACQSEAEF